jgi:hypothetical protein
MRCVWIVAKCRPAVLYESGIEANQNQAKRVGKRSDTHASFCRTGAEGKREVDGRAARTIYRAQNLEDANHLIFLEGKVFLVVDLGFFAFENGSKGE